MDFKKALEFVDQLTYAKTGKHLNDLEREVFIGSWQGRTYDEIYPHNPEYIEKYVGYKLWQKLSSVLGEKVTKKKIQGAIERAIQHQQRVLVTHHNQEAEVRLATQLQEAIAMAGYPVFIANIGTIAAPVPETGVKPRMTHSLTYEGLQSHQEGETLTSEEELISKTSIRGQLSHINTELAVCDYFILLLSPQATVSEMVIEALKQAKELRDSRHTSKPILLPIRVNCPATLRFNHDLRSYLSGIRQGDWNSAVDTPKIVEAVLHQLAGTRDWGCAEESEEKQTGLSGNMGSVTSNGGAFSALTSSTQLPTPLPVAEPELPKGQVRLASAFYVERVPYEAQCYKEIIKPGTLIRLKAPRQMGKTSLMARILDQAREQGCRTVPLSFQHADQGVFANLNQLLQWFCARITRKLHLTYSIEEYWTDTYGSKDNCTAYFEDCLLSEADAPLVLGLDEVDRVFQYPEIAEDFFGLLRAWYEEAGYGDRDSDRWEKLRLVVVHSTEVYIPLDVNQSPFNVGLPIELSEFSFEQVCDLAQRHGLNWQTHQLQQLMTMVGGHPYLVRVALYHIARGELSLNELIEMSPTESGIYGDHLRRHLWNLQQYPDLAIAFAQVIKSNEPVELLSVLAFKLHSMGLVELQGNLVKPRFELYRQYFRDRLSLIIN